MNSAMRRLWSDPEFLRMIATPDTNPAAASARAPRAHEVKSRAPLKDDELKGLKRPRFEHPGDGEVVPVEEAFAELGRKTGVVLESGSHAFHRDMWQNVLGKQGEAPTAFKYAGRIRVDL